MCASGTPFKTCEIELSSDFWSTYDHGGTNWFRAHLFGVGPPMSGASCCPGLPSNNIPVSPDC